MAKMYLSKENFTCPKQLISLGPVHMHKFTYVSIVPYVSKFTYGAYERTYSREYKYSWSKLG